MNPTKKNSRLIKVTGIWLLVAGVAASGWGLFCLGDGLIGIVQNTWEGLAIFLAPPILPGVLCLLAGIWTLKRRHWKLAIWFSGVSTILFGLTILPTIFLSRTKKEFY